MHRLAATVVLGSLIATSSVECRPLRAAKPNSVPAATLAVEEILRRAEAIRNPDTPRASEVEIVSVLPDARAPARQASYSIAVRGAADSLALRQSGDDMRGGTLLLKNDRMWLLRPGLGTRSAYELDGAQGRLGDWVVLRVAGLDLRAGWQTRLVGEESYDAQPCYKLELTSASTHLPWARLLYWVGKSDFRPKRLEGYAPDGFLVSMIRYEGFDDGRLGPYARKVVVEGGTPQEEIHTATFSDVRPLTCDPASFSLAGQLAVKDAARERGVMSKNATRIRIEELLPPAQRP